MTVSTSYAPLSFNGDDATTAFAVTWPFFDSSLVVTLVDSTGVETVKTITTHYTVSGGTDSDGLPATGTVTMLTAPASGETLRITRNTSKVQSSSWTNGGAYQAKTLEATLDKIILIAQETQAGINDDITGDVMQLNTSGATDYWDAESHVIRNITDGTADSDAATYGQLSSAVLASGNWLGGTGATDNAILRANGIGGATIQSSSATIDDSGNISAPNLQAVVASRTAMKALDTTVVTTAYLNEGGRSGVFVWDGSDLSTEVAADPNEGLYVSSGDGSAGAWVRGSNYGTPKMFGAPVDGASDDTDAIDAMLATCATLGLVARFPKYDEDYQIANVSVPANCTMMFEDAIFIIDKGASSDNDGFRTSGNSNIKFLGSLTVKLAAADDTNKVWGVRIGDSTGTTEGTNIFVDHVHGEHVALAMNLSYIQDFVVRSVTSQSCKGEQKSTSDLGSTTLGFQGCIRGNVGTVQARDNSKAAVYFSVWSASRHNDNITIDSINVDSIAGTTSSSGLGMRDGRAINIGKVNVKNGYRGVAIVHETADANYILDDITIGEVVVYNPNSTNAVGVLIRSDETGGKKVGRVSIGRTIVDGAPLNLVQVRQCEEFSFGTISVTGTSSVSDGVFFYNVDKILGGEICVNSVGTNGVRILSTSGATNGAIDAVKVVDANLLDASQDAIRIEDGAIDDGFSIRYVGVDAPTGTLAGYAVRAGTNSGVFVGDIVGAGYANVMTVRSTTLIGVRAWRYYRTAAPTAGTWSNGDIIYNSSFSTTAPFAWGCRSAGSPGTWEELSIHDNTDLQVRAINARRNSSGSFGLGSAYHAIVVGDLSGSNAGNGGIYSIGRYDKANEPFCGLVGWDDNSTRQLYFGGGSWNVPSCTQMRFFTAAAYNETNNAGVVRLTITPEGNVVVGSGALAAGATDGFLYIPTCAGTPTGTPSTQTGRVALVYDSTNNLLYANDGGGWVATNSP